MVAPPTVPEGQGGYASRGQLQQGSPYMPNTPIIMGQAKMPVGMMQYQQGMAGQVPPMGVARPMSQGGAMPPPPPPPGMPGDRISQLKKQTSIGMPEINRIYFGLIGSQYTKLHQDPGFKYSTNYIKISKFLSCLKYQVFKVIYTTAVYGS